MKTKRKIPWKVIFILPAVAVPLVAALFYGMGGGAPTVPAEKRTGGLNTNLPGSLADNKSPMDKFSIYQLAEADSLRRIREQSADPVYGTSATNAETGNVFPWQESTTPVAVSHIPTSATDPHEQRVQEKLQELERELSRPVASTPAVLEQPAVLAGDIIPPHTGFPPETAGSGPDPELAQINDVLEKVLDVQYPERVTQRLQVASAGQKSRVFPVARPEPAALTDIMTIQVSGDSATPYPVTNQLAETNGFFEWSAQQTAIPQDNAVRAVVHETRTVVSGATIKLRLEQDIFIQGVRIPAGHFVFGKGNLSGDRYTVAVRDIRYHGSLFPVSLEVIGMDGIPGIHIEGAISREVLRDGATSGVQGLQLATMDPSLSAQAAAATVETAKTLLYRKMRLTTVTLKSGEPVLLRDAHPQ